MLAVLMVRLVDDTRVVRMRDAESLLALDVSTAPGRFSDALASWKAARDRDPATPDIDRMIDEATRRLAAPPPR